MDTDTLSRLGVNACEKEFLKIGFAFREQPISDYGIDAIVELKEEDYYSGKLIAIQIKSGTSFFREKSNNSIIFRGKIKHYSYWANYTIPVIIVLYDPDTDKCVWGLFDKNKTQNTGKTWKMEIPINQEIGLSKQEFTRITNNITPYQRRFNSMIIAKEWMEYANNYNGLILEVNEWINKTSGRGEFCLKYDEISEKIIFKRTILGFGNRPYKEVLQDLFPWADINIDAEFYCEDIDSYYYKKYDEIKEGIYPYRNVAGEVNFYRLILTVNQLGKSFLLVDDFLNTNQLYYLDKLM